MISFLEKLGKQIEAITPFVDVMFDNSTIYYDNPNDRHSNIVVIGPVYHYSKKDEKTQLILKEKYSKFYENLRLLLPKANPKTIRKIEETDKRITRLIQQDSAPSSPAQGKSNFRKEVQTYVEFLHLLSEPEKRILILPDTNSIIQYPDPITYRKITTEPFSFVILPTVLHELEKHKAFHRDDKFREKAKNVIRRLKGYRTQGNPLEGVTVDKTIMVKMIAIEPDFKNTLHWLDSENADDRIIANALQLQIQNPSDEVILVTGDINLQNKAQMANLSFEDTDIFEG